MGSFQHFRSLVPLGFVFLHEAFSARIPFAEWSSVSLVKLYKQKKGQHYLISKQQLTNCRVIFVFYDCSNDLQYRRYP